MIVRSAVAGAAVSLLVANVVQLEHGSGVLALSEWNVAGHQVACSWTVFVIAFAIMWLLSKAANGTRYR